MDDKSRSERTVPTEQTRDPNISTENQPEGAARRPSDTLDREPERDPQSGGAIPSNYNPATMTRRGEEEDSRAAQQGAGGGNVARDIGSRDEEKSATGGDPESTRVTKQDKVQRDTGTQSDHEGAQS